MSNLSLSGASDDASAFMRREAQLVMPVALATFGLSLLLLELVTPVQAPAREVELSPWMLWLIPASLLGFIGQLAISSLVLAGGCSVREALGLAMKRLPLVLAVVVIAGLVALLAVVLVAFAAGLVAALAGLGADATTMVMSALVMGLILWVAARLLLFWPVMADRGGRPLAVLKETWQLSKGRVGRFVAVLFAFALLYGILLSAARFAFGAIFLIAGRAVGSEEVGRFLAALAVALIASVVLAFWSIFVAQLYRRSAPATSGS